MRSLAAAAGVAVLVALGAACGGDDDHELPPVTTEPAFLQTMERCFAETGVYPPATSPALDECLADG